MFDTEIYANFRSSNKISMPSNYCIENFTAVFHLVAKFEHFIIEKISLHILINSKKTMIKNQFSQQTSVHILAFRNGRKVNCFMKNDMTN